LLCVPVAIRVVGGLAPGGWPEVMERNRRLALAGQQVLAAALELPAPCPAAMVGSMAAIPLPDGTPSPPASRLGLDPLQEGLLEGFRIEVPVFPWPAPPKRLLRISAQLYNDLPQYQRLAAALRQLL
jgi:isopenicillin-N epimerase